MQHTSKEWVKVWHDPVLGGLELHHATSITHTCSRHMHDYYVVGVVEAGIQAFSYRGARQITPAGGVFVINPGEAHTGEALIASGYTYRTLYPDLSLLKRAASDELAPGDLFAIAPGHDSWVIGEEPYISLHFQGAEDYAH